MGSFSIWHLLIVLVVGMLLFGGKNKISNVMGDFAKGIKAFKSGMKEEETAENAPPERPKVTPPTSEAEAKPSAAREHA
jgi:sec-independent protein translocase protein TatA